MAFSRVLTFTDPFPYQAALQGADITFFPATKGEFRAEMTQLRMDKLWLQRHHQALPQVNAGSMKADRRTIGFLTGPKGQTMRHRGMDVSTGDIIIHHYDEYHQRSEPDCRYGSMSLKLDDFDAAHRAITGREFVSVPSTHLFRPTVDLMERLLKLHEMVGETAKTAPELFGLPEAVRAMEQQLSYLMVRCLIESVSTQMTGGGHRHDMIVAKFEEYLEANPNTPLYLAEICAAIDVAERTLRTACEEHLGMGPIRYLALRRMHLVRRALSRAIPSTTTVTKIATDHGFWELGRFSVNYHAMFGETPSATLHRPSDDQRMILDRPTSLANSEIA